MTATYRLLLLEGAPEPILREEASAGESERPAFAVTRVRTLAEGLACARAERFDVIVSGHQLADANGLDVVRSLQRVAPYCPIVVLEDVYEEARAVEFVREGADEVLVRSELAESVLRRVLLRTIERRLSLNRAQAVLESDLRMAGTVQRIGTELMAEPDQARLVQRATDEARQLSGAAFAAFFYEVVEAEGGPWMLYALSGAPPEAFASFPLPRNTPLFAATLEGARVVRSDDVTQEPLFGQWPPHHGLPPGHLPVRSYLAVPVVSRAGTPLGGFFLGHPAPARFSERDESIVGAIATSAAVAIENGRRHEAEQRAREAAQRESRAKTEFLHSLSRELRTPLNAIIGYTDLWLIGLPSALPSSLQTQVQRVRRSAQHVLALIEEMLAFSGLEAAHDRFDLAPVLIQDQLEMVITFIEPLALEKRLLLQVEPPGRPVTIATDARKLRQVLVSLLSNAVQHTEQGTIRLVVESRPGEVSFIVVDASSGLTSVDRERMFDSAASGPDARAAGSGLNAARRLARLLGGEVTVQGQAGGGTVLTLHLPADPIVLPGS